MTTIAEGPEPRRQRGTGTVTRVREGVYRVRVGRGTTATGNPRYRTETVRGTRAEAEARAAVIYEEMGANERGMTLAAYYRRRFPLFIKRQNGYIIPLSIIIISQFLFFCKNLSKLIS